jgi:hypothetical protein
MQSSLGTNLVFIIKLFCSQIQFPITDPSLTDIIILPSPDYRITTDIDIPRYTLNNFHDPELVQSHAL